MRTKFFFMTMIAVVCVACNDLELPKDDNKALTAVTTDMVQQMGESQAEFEKAVLAAGFVKADEPKEIDVVMPDAPGRLSDQRNQIVRRHKAAEEETEAYYIYGLSSDYPNLSTDELEAKMMDRLAKGKSCIMVYAYFSNDRLMCVSSGLYAPLTEKINTVYTRVSDDLYKQLPQSKETLWTGSIRIDSDGDGKAEYANYTDHAEFSAEIAKAQGIMADERAYSVQPVSDTSGYFFGYYCLWDNPTEESQEKMRDSGMSTPFVCGSFILEGETMEYD